MKLNLQSICAAGISALLCLLAGCGGGDGASPAGTSVHGVAAVGAPLSGATIYLKDSTPIDPKLPNGGGSKTIFTIAGTNGGFEFDTSSLKPPFMLRARKPNGDFLYSVSGGNGGTININPLTNLLVGELTKKLANVNDPDALFLSFGSSSGSLAGASGQKTIDGEIKNIYAKASLEFKSAAAILDEPVTGAVTTAAADSNFLTGTYKIPSKLDSAFDKFNLYYDASSGQSQERIANTTDRTSFGLNGKITKLESSAGNYTGSVVDPNGNNVNIFANIDPKGKMLVYVEGNGVFFGQMPVPAVSAASAPAPASAASAPVPGILYYLDRNGLSLTSSNVVDDDGHTGIELSKNDENSLGFSAGDGCNNMLSRVCVQGTVTATGLINPAGWLAVYPDVDTSNWSLRNGNLPILNFTKGKISANNVPSQTQLASIRHSLAVTFSGRLDPKYEASGQLSLALSDSIDAFGVLHGLEGSIAYRIGLTLTATVQPDGSIQISLPISGQVFPQSFNLIPSTVMTYGNGLNSSGNNRSAPFYKDKTLDGFIKVGSGNQKPGKNGMTVSDSVKFLNVPKYYTLPDIPSSACQVERKADFWLEDLEFSTYRLSITETISNSTAASTTNICASLGVHTMAGRAIFTDKGLLAFLVDVDSENNASNTYASVLVKYFTK